MQVLWILAQCEQQVNLNLQLLIDKNNSYLKYIDTTTKRLKESLANLNIKALNNIYEKILN